LARKLAKFILPKETSFKKVAFEPENRRCSAKRLVLTRGYMIEQGVPLQQERVITDARGHIIKLVKAGGLT